MGAFAGEGSTVGLLLVLGTLEVLEPDTLIAFRDLREDTSAGKRGGRPADADGGGSGRKNEQNSSEQSRETHGSTLERFSRWCKAKTGDYQY